MEIAKKLQIHFGKSIYIMNRPKDMKLEVPISRKETGDCVLLFATDSKTLLRNCKIAVEAARSDKLSWIAYPKAGKLSTDLNREKLLSFMKPYGIQGVRLVSLDGIWSAMRFRPRSGIR
jgi:hypothetical protein